MKFDELNTGEQLQVLSKIIRDFNKSINDSELPEKTIYKLAASTEINQARSNFLKSCQLPLIKKAFDTRKIDQETERNPRLNCQYYHRGDQFTTEDVQNRVEILSKLVEPLNEIKKKYNNQPEYLNSYASKLYDIVKNTLKIGTVDHDIFEPQLNYLEELLNFRYRLNPEDLLKMDKISIKQAILNKDEGLLRRGAILEAVSEPTTTKVVKDGNLAFDQQSLVNALFGNTNFRRDGEKSVKRTITITLTDTVED